MYSYMYHECMYSSFFQNGSNDFDGFRVLQIFRFLNRLISVSISGKFIILVFLTLEIRFSKTVSLFSTSHQRKQLPFSFAYQIKRTIPPHFVHLNYISNFGVYFCFSRYFNLKSEITPVKRQIKAAYVCVCNFVLSELFVYFIHRAEPSTKLLKYEYD